MAGFQWGRSRLSDDADINDWIAQRNAELQLGPDADAAGRDAWSGSTQSGQNLAAARPTDVATIGIQALGQDAPPVQDNSRPSNPDDETPLPLSTVEPAFTPVSLPDTDGLTSLPDAFRSASRFATARPGDSISRIVGTSDPAAIGRFLTVNGLDGRNSTLLAGQGYAIPDRSRDASPEEVAAGQRLLQTDNTRLAQAESETVGGEAARASAGWNGTRAPANEGAGQSVPDAAGELYDQQMARIRAKRDAEAEGLRSPLDMAKDALHDFQRGPKIQRPNLAESFIPVVGPAWAAAADLQDGNYGGAAFNGAMAVADALPVGAAFKGLNAARKGIGILRDGSVTAKAAADAIRKAGLAGAGEEIHHTIALKGTSRSVQDARNHYALLKVLPKDVHRRLTGSWAGKPRYDPIRRAWHGSTDWQKSVPTALAGYAVDGWENLTHPFSSPSEPDSSGV
jgi:hypothetical protein